MELTKMLEMVRLTEDELIGGFITSKKGCVGLMMANEVPMERIRDWVGHSDIRTTVNIYGHLEYQSKKKTAKIIEKSLPLKKVGAANV
jgi:hypothetical protein